MQNGSPSGVSMFSYAEGVNISGASFTINSPNSITNVIHSAGVNPVNPIDLLRETAALNAVLDSNERFNAPRCEPETREAIIQEILEWINETLPFATMLWLHGSAGVGKSAIVQTVAELCRRTGQYGASFFFSRTEVTGGRNDGDRVLPTLIYQMAQTIPALLPLIREVIERDQGIFVYSRATQLELLLVQYLISLVKAQSKRLRLRGFRSFFRRKSSANAESTFKPYLIVVDGLDEGSDPDVQCDLLRLFATAVTRLQLPIRFLISSRPEAHIIQTFKKDVTIPIRLLNLAQARDINKDIRLFLARRFESIRHFHPIGGFLPMDWPEPHVIETLVERSSEHFIFPSIVMEYVASSQHHPVDRLDVILKLVPLPDGDNPYKSLDTLYRHIFSAVPKHHLQKVLSLLGLIHVQNQSNIRKMVFGLFPVVPEAPSGETPFTLSQRELIERILDLRPGEVELILTPLLSIVECQENIRVLHASIFDFLCNSSRAKEFHVNLSDAHTAILHYFIKHEDRLVFYTTGYSQLHFAHPSYIFQHLTFFMYHLSNTKAPISESLCRYVETFNLLYHIALSKEVLQRTCSSDTSSYHTEVFKLIAALGFFFEWLRKQCSSVGDNSTRLDYHSIKINKALLSCYGDPRKGRRSTIFSEDQDHRYQYAVFRTLESFNKAAQTLPAVARSRVSDLPAWVTQSPWGDPTEWGHVPRGVLYGMKYYFLAWFSHSRRPGSAQIREALSAVSSADDKLDIELHNLLLSKVASTTLTFTGVRKDTGYASSIASHNSSNVPVHSISGIPQ